MDLLEITRRTKAAVREWADDPEAKVLLDDKLSKFQNGDLDTLRVRINGQFVKQSGFPFTSKEWEKLTLKTVRDVRDAAKKKLNDGAQ